MIRLISLEFMKLKNTRYFWIFTLLFAFFLLVVPLSAKVILDYWTEMGASIKGIGMNDLPLFDFIDIWQNLTYLFKWPAILLAFIPVISMANEFRYGTVKQNIIDGLSRTELITSKLLFAALISIIVGLIVLLIGLYMGYTYSPVQSMRAITKNLGFIPAYMMILFGYQVFCLFITLIIKKSGITILFLLFYFFAFEGLAYGLTKWNSEHPELTSLFPLRGMSDLVRNPFPKYALQQVVDSIQLGDLLITTAHITIFSTLSIWIFNKRDVR